MASASAYCGTGATSSAVGTQDWTSPTNIQGVPDGGAFGANTAQIQNGITNLVSYYLKATNFGFAIPAGATIDGIEVNWIGRAGTGFAPNVKDNRVRIVKGGTVGATDKSNAADWPGSYTTRTYGSSSDLWGETWTYSDINGSTFGAVISLKGDADNGIYFDMDACQIVVYYTAAASQDTPELRGRPDGLRGFQQMSQLLVR